MAIGRFSHASRLGKMKFLMLIGAQEEQRCRADSIGASEASLFVRDAAAHFGRRIGGSLSRKAPGQKSI